MKTKSVLLFLLLKKNETQEKQRLFYVKESLSLHNNIATNCYWKKYKIKKNSGFGKSAGPWFMGNWAIFTLSF